MPSKFFYALITSAITILVFSLLITFPSVALEDASWVQIYGDVEKDSIFRVLQTSDGGFALAGYTESFGEGMADFWLVKTDSNGGIL